MSGPVLLAIDLGTSACKVVAYRAGRAVATASEPIATHRPDAREAEQDPDAWWDALRRLVPAVVGQVGQEVAAIGVTAQSDSLVAVDAQGDPVRPCILWMDGRGERELGQVRAALGDERIREVTGLRPGLSFTIAKVAWMRAHEPDAFARVRWLLQPKDHLVLRLTGRAVTDPSSASRSMCLDRWAGAWWPDILDAAGLDEGLLPPILPSGDRVGGLGQRAARELGLPVGTPVANGAADRAAEALATGVEGGEAMVSMGTATGIVRSIPATERSVDSAVLTPSHAVPGRSMALLSVATSGAAFAWLMGILGADGSEEAWSRLMGEADASPPGSRGVTFLPFLAGAKSVRWAAGATGMLAGLGLSAGRGDLVRAALEGIAFETAACLDRLGAMRPVERTILVGGGHRDDLAARILVDVTGIPALRLREPHAGAMGAMLLAGQAIGLWADPLAVARRERQGTHVVADPGRHAAYAAARARYDALCATVGLPPVAP